MFFHQSAAVVANFATTEYFSNSSSFVGALQNPLLDILVIFDDH